MKSNPLILNNVSFSYDSFSKPIFQSITLNIHKGWTGVIGANGIGKTTFLKICTKKLKIAQGNISGPEFSIYCEQRTDHLPGNIENFIYSYDKNAIKLKSLLEIDESYIHRWNTLSHGERKRIQIGYALYQEPNLLAIDEPTNHLDNEVKEIVKKTLNEFQGIGLLVSHDRELLDTLCSHCIFINPPDVIFYKGNYTESRQQYETNVQYNKKMYTIMQKQKKRIQSSLQNKKLLQQNSNKRISKKGISRKDHDSKAKINGAKLTGKDAVGGKLINQMQTRLDQTLKEQEKYKIEKKYKTGIEFNSKTSKRKNLLYLKSGKIKLNENKKLYFNDLNINATDRIGITGNNGCGKSTLVKFILNYINLEKNKILYIPQEIDIKETKIIYKNIKTLNSEQLGTIMTLITRLGSNPKTLLESELYSPGETRKLLFAFGLIQNPRIIIMDEATNHLDIVAAECLENALSDLNCALLLVSHDNIFLDKLVNIYWHIEKMNNDYNLKILYKI